MKFLFSIFTGLVLLVSLAQTTFAQSPSPSVSPTPSSAPSQVDSFELFWPVVAGRTQGDSLYFLKSFKENLRELLLFSSFKKADYNITLSVKRVVEAEKLFLESKDIANGSKTLGKAQEKRDRSFDLINKAKADGKKTEDLINSLDSSLDKQESLLASIKSKVESDEARSAIDENIGKLNDLQGKLRKDSSGE